MKRKTFTMVELVVVCVILGIVVVIAIPGYNHTQAMARKETFEANVREIESTLSNYKVETFSVTEFFPPTLSVLEDKKLLTNVPKNPYTQKSMLSQNPEESGIVYKQIAGGANYVLLCVQKDKDDFDKDSNTKEVVVCSNSKNTNYSLLPQNIVWNKNGVLIQTDSSNTLFAVTAYNTDNYIETQIANIQDSEFVVLTFKIRSEAKSKITVSINDQSEEIIVDQDWQKYAILYKVNQANDITIRFSTFDLNNETYLSNLQLIDG